jgi:hypothetical protein
LPRLPYDLLTITRIASEEHELRDLGRLDFLFPRDRDDPIAIAPRLGRGGLPGLQKFLGVGAKSVEAVFTAEVIGAPLCVTWLTASSGAIVIPQTGSTTSAALDVC